MQVKIEAGALWQINTQMTGYPSNSCNAEMCLSEYIS
jgi:hypothetical protein